MHSYLEEDDRNYSREGIVGTILVHLILLICFLLFSMRAPFPLPEERGFLVNFGEVDQGKGKEQPTAKKASAPAPIKGVKESKTTKPKAAPPKPTPKAAKKIMTSKSTEAPALPVKKDKPKPAVKNTKVKEKKEDVAKPPKEVKVEKPREADENALFQPKSDNTATNNAKGNGITEGQTDMGSTKGAINNSTNYNNMQSGPPGVGFNLNGRSLIDIPPPKDRSQAVGIVVIRIKVDKKGNVISADYVSKGSTTSDSGLRALAEKSAKEATFNFEPNAPEVQSGTITFTFTTQ